MPGLYGFTGNSNVSVNVGNTIGLYQQNTGNVYVVNNAITLLNTLSQSGNVNFALTDGNSKVLAYTANIGTTPGTYGNIDYYPVLSVTSDGRVTAVSTISVSAATGGYGNANVAAYLPTYTGSLSNSSSIISLVANAATQATSIDNLNSEYTSLNSTVIAQGVLIGQKANIAGQVFTGNVQAPYFIGDGSQLTNLNIPSGNVTLTGNVTGSGTTGSPINTTIAATGVVAGVYGDVTNVPQLTVGADGRVTAVSNIVISAGSTYSNTNVAAYLTTATITTTGNITAANLTTGGNLTASYVLGDGSLLTNLPVQPGTYSNANVASYLPVYTGNVSAGNVVTTGGTVVNAGLSTAGNITTSTNVNANTVHTTDGIYAQGNVTAPYFIGDGGSLTNIVTKLVAGANIALSPAGGQGQVTISQIGGTAPLTSTGYYGSFYDTTDQYANVATTSYTININNTVGTNGVSLVNGNAMSFSNSGVYNVAFSIQFVNTDNAQHEANVWLVQNGTALSQTNSQVTVPARATPSTPGAILMTVPFVITVVAGDTVQLAWQQDSGTSAVRIASFTAGTSPTRPATPGVVLNATQVTSVTGNQYGNSNVATFLSAGFGSNTITTTGNITAGNLIATSYVEGDGSKLTNLPVQAGTYSNANVASYLPVYNGSIGSTGSVMNNINMGGTLTVAPNIVIGTTPSTTITNGSYSTTGGSAGTFVTLTASTGNVFAGSTTGNTSIQDGAVTTSGRVTAGNVVSTSGYFWANGTAYSTGGGGTSFSGDLAGNTLTDSTRGRILANASPNQTVVQIGSYTQGVVVNTPPSYTGANLNSQNQTVSLATIGNVNFLTTYANATLRTTNGTTAYLGVTATSANGSINPSDRVRGFAAALDINLNGKNWGALTSASNTLTPIVTNGQTQNIYGTGQVGQAVAIGAAINITPVNGSISAQYVTSNFPSIAYSTAGGGATASNISTARLYAGAITATSNLTVTNAIALHTFSGWVSANTSLVTNAYTVLNEDTRSIIQTAGNISATGTLSAFGNTRVNGYLSPNKNYYDTSTGSNIVVSGSNTRSFQQIALNTNATIYSSAPGFDTVYDFSIQQDGTGGRTLSWFQTGGGYTPIGILNPAPNSITYARAIMSDTGYWTVSYSNATVPVLTVAQANSFTGQAGSQVAISNGTGKNNGQLAYWDVTNTRWSWVDTNTAVI